MNNFKFIFTAIIILSMFFPIHAQFNDNKDFSSSNKNIFSNQTPLTSEEAFNLSLIENSMEFRIESDHYLYKDKLKITVNGELYSDYNTRKSVPINDGFYGNTEVFYDFLEIPLKNLNSIYKLEVEFQGCSANFNICYPPEKKILINKKNKVDLLNKEVEQDKKRNHSYFNFDSLFDNLNNKGLLFNIVFFFIAGILISFTPCILPMIPIISSIVIGQETKSKKKAFILSLFYVLGSSSAYASIGLIVSITSVNIQIYLQHPFFISISVIILFMLSLNMMGLLNFSLFNNFKDKINNKINNYKNIKLKDVFIVGFLSTLIVSPCVAAPLAASVIYISTTNNILLGTSVLFSFGLGIGLILILISTNLNRFKIKSGSYLNEVKYFMSFLLLLACVFILERLLNDSITNILYLSIIVSYSTYISRKLNFKFAVILNLIFVSYIYFLHINVENLSKSENQYIYKEIKNLEQYNVAIDLNSDVFIKVTADWCTYCKQMEKEYLMSISFLKKTENLIKYKIDLSSTSEDKNKLLKKLKVIAPPTILIIKNKKIVNKEIGYISKKNLYEKLKFEK
jgi:thiol:disulfide interchange protein DsbD